MTLKRAPACRADGVRYRSGRMPARDRRPYMPSSTVRQRARLAGVACNRRPAPRRARRRRRRRPAESRCCRNLPSRSTLPLATQLSATPPARQRFSMPVSAARLRVSRSTTSSSTAWIEAARSMCFCVKQVDLRIARRPAEQRIEPLVRHRQPGAVIEIVQVQPETSRPALRSIR